MWGMRKRTFLLGGLLLCLLTLVFAQDRKSSAAKPEGADEAMSAMAGHEQMGAHMLLTSLRPVQPGDKQRADAVVNTARQTLEKYRDYNAALGDGYKIFLPNVPAKMYHFTNWEYAMEAAFRFNPEHPTSLLYEKLPQGGYKLIGAMYTAPARLTDAQLDARIPLSIAQWHEHTNFCQAPKGREKEYFGAHALFGLQGSITTEEHCKAAGGTFRPRIFGWMVHVYPFEQKQEDIWSVERQMDHGGGDHEMHDHAHMKM